MSRYMYKFSMSYVNNNEVTEIKQENIRSVCIERDYDKLHMPVMLVDFMLDKNLVDTIILNNKSGLFNVACYKFCLEGDQYTECVFQGQFNYFLQEDINYNKDIDYSDKSKELNDGVERKDQYRNIPIGMLYKNNVDNNKHSTNNIVYNTTMINIVTSELSYLGNLVIEPFTYNKVIDQLIIPPTDSVTKLLEMLNKVSVFYDTKFRFFMDFDTAYILSTSGKGVSMKNEKYNSVVIDIRNITASNAFEQGMREDSANSCYSIPISTKDTTYVDNNFTDKTFNKIIAVIDVGKLELEIKSSSISGILNNLKSAADKITSSVKNVQNKLSNVGNTLTTIKNNIVSDVEKSVKANTTISTSINVVSDILRMTTMHGTRSISLLADGDSEVDIEQVLAKLEEIAKDVEDINTFINNVPSNYDNIRDNLFDTVMEAGSFDNYIGGVDPINYTNNTGALRKLYKSVKAHTTNRTTEINELINPTSQKYTELLNDLNDLIDLINNLPDSVPGGVDEETGQPSNIDISAAKDVLTDLMPLIEEIQSCVSNTGSYSGELLDMITLCSSTADKCSDAIETIASTPNILQEEYNGSSSYLLSTASDDDKDKYNSYTVSNSNSLADTSDKQYLSDATRRAKSRVSTRSIISTSSTNNSLTISGFGDLGKIGDNALNQLSNFKNSILSDIKTGLDGISDLTHLGSMGLSSVEVDINVNGLDNIVSTANSILNTVEKGKLIRIPNDNANILKQIKSELELSASKLVINKNDLDSSIITPNKVYAVKNYDTHSDKNGKFLLANKKEIYLRQDDSFVLATVLTFRKIPDNNTNS